MVRLESSDGKIFTLDYSVASQSVLLKNILEDIGENEENSIPLPNVTSNILEKVFEYAQHVEVVGTNLNVNEISKWEEEFMDVAPHVMFDIILAANYLDMKHLLDLGCKTVANIMKGKTIDEIRVAFSLPPLTDEEQEQ
ncbi:hypothetical protein HK096_009925, partial [Nowakowskiella sp. JEL0078]